MFFHDFTMVREIWQHHMHMHTHTHTISAFRVEKELYATLKKYFYKI